MARTYLVEAETASVDLGLAAREVECAVEGLRKAGRLDMLMYGLLACATLRRMLKDLRGAFDVLEELMGTATTGSMMLHQADAHLEYARLFLSQGNQFDANIHLSKAKEIIEDTGYYRRKKDVEQKIEKQLAGLS
jgi:hypothetical protein